MNLAPEPKTRGGKANPAHAFSKFQTIFDFLPVRSAPSLLMTWGGGGGRAGRTGPTAVRAEGAERHGGRRNPPAKVGRAGAGACGPAWPCSACREPRPRRQSARDDARRGNGVYAPGSRGEGRPADLRAAKSPWSGAGPRGGGRRTRPGPAGIQLQPLWVCAQRVRTPCNECGGATARLRDPAAAPRAGSPARPQAAFIHVHMYTFTHLHIHTCMQTYMHGE